MIKRKKQPRNFQQTRARSQSQDFFTSPNFEQEMKCHEVLEDLNYFTNNQQQDQQNDDNTFCNCTKCQNLVSNPQNKELDADEKKRQKRRQYKKRQKLKIQLKKQQALKDLTSIIVDIYQLKTDSETERFRIQQCLKTIEKNQNRFYEFINAVIRQQVEAIKKQMRVCLSQLASEAPNFSKVPRLYEQFMKIKDASPQVQFIINYFIKIISEKNNEPARYHRDLDKKTFKFLLISDALNRNNFIKLMKLLQEGKIKPQREKQMLKIVIQMIKKLNISSECSSSQQDSEDDEYSRTQSNEDYEEQIHHTMTQNTTKSSQRQDEQHYFSQQEQKQDSSKKAVRRKRKMKNLKLYEPSFQKTFQALLVLQKTLNNKNHQKFECNLQEEWIQQFRQRHLKKSLFNKMKQKE